MMNEKEIEKQFMKLYGLNKQQLKLIKGYKNVKSIAKGRKIGKNINYEWMLKYEYFGVMMFATHENVKNNIGFNDWYSPRDITKKIFPKISEEQLNQFSCIQLNNVTKRMRSLSRQGYLIKKLTEMTSKAGQKYTAFIYKRVK